MFFNAILELLDFLFLQVHLHIDTFTLGNFEFLLFRVQPLFLLHHIEHVHYIQECGDRPEYDLQDPEVHTRDQEGLIIADIFTMRLPSVTMKGKILIISGWLSRCPD